MGLKGKVTLGKRRVSSLPSMRGEQEGEEQMKRRRCSVVTRDKPTQAHPCPRKRDAA